MTEKPIIFDANEVNAVLAGNKTQHRIPILTSEQVSAGYEWDFGADGDSAVCIKEIDDERQEVLLKPCPFGAIGNRLWVKEEHARQRRWEEKFSLTGAHYFADGALTLDVRHDAGMLEKHPASNMPRWASRLLLEITDIRIERVQDITLGDSLKEARDGLMDFAADYWMPKHGEAAWFTNPWVWVIEFKVVGDNKIYQQKDGSYAN